MSPGGAGDPPRTGLRGPLTGDPLAARLFPLLPDQVRWGLDRTERLLSRVGSPHRGLPVLHVGGTNGKGSVARIWAAILQEAGLRVGLYTSPPLLSFRERILVDGAPLPDEVLEELAGELRSHLVKLSPSPFEAFTALSLLAFRRMEVQIAVLEVGMGGRLDATNVVDPILTVVTNVTLEHQAMLGSSLVAIAREKAGILKPGIPVYTASDDPAVLTVLAEEAAARGAPLTRVPPLDGEVALDGVRGLLRTRRWGELHLHSPLLGRHQLQNVALAVRSLESLPPRFLPGRRAIQAGVGLARVPGRLQLEEEPPRRWLLDVAHNPAGSLALAEALRTLPLAGPRVGVVGILADKAWGPMLETLATVLDRILLVVPPSAPPSRRWNPEEVAGTVPPSVQEKVEVFVVEGAFAAEGAFVAEGAFAGEGVFAAGGAVGAEGALGGEDWVGAEGAFRAGLDRARTLTASGGTVVVTGSFHTVGDALRALDRIPAEALPPSADSG